MKRCVLFLAGIVFLATTPLASSRKEICSSVEFPSDVSPSGELILRCTQLRNTYSVMNYIQDECYTDEDDIPILFAAAIYCGESIGAITSSWECPSASEAVRFSRIDIDRIDRALLSVTNMHNCLFEMVVKLLEYLRDRKVNCYLSYPTTRADAHYLYVVREEIVRLASTFNTCDSVQRLLVGALANWLS